MTDPITERLDEMTSNCHIGDIAALIAALRGVLKVTRHAVIASLDSLPSDIRKGAYAQALLTRDAIASALDVTL